MSLVAYDYSDDSADENNDSNEDLCEKTDYGNRENKNQNNSSLVPNVSAIDSVNEDDISDDLLQTRISSDIISFSTLPKPKSVIIDEEIIEEECVPSKKEIELRPQKPSKDKGPIKISVPSLSNFKDIEEGKSKNKPTMKPSQKGTGLFAVLPPPKGSMEKSAKSLIPHVCTVKSNKTPIVQNEKPANKPTVKKVNLEVKKTCNLFKNSNHDSNSEDEEDSAEKKIDFFSLSASSDVLENVDVSKVHEETQKMVTEYLSTQKAITSNKHNTYSNAQNSAHALEKQEIILKNEVAVGPKLPVPEQEYNIDSKGNVAFDEKAIEYLCGKRGVKRKNKELESVDIIEINGEDIKPDEREWLVKALTEQPIHRPVSLSRAGPSSQSKKKHQITYLAHQAKVMELELQNQWAQNRLTRKQTQSKYGF